jgi:hypothetical protein
MTITDHFSQKLVKFNNFFIYLFYLILTVSELVQLFLVRLNLRFLNKFHSLTNVFLDLEILCYTFQSNKARMLIRRKFCCSCMRNFTQITCENADYYIVVWFLHMIVYNSHRFEQITRSKVTQVSHLVTMTEKSELYFCDEYFVTLFVRFLYNFYP